MGLKRKVVVLKKLVFQSGVGFLIQWFLDHGLGHLVDLFKKFPMNQDFIWLGWINYNSSIKNHVFTSLTLRKKSEYGLGVTSIFLAHLHRANKINALY